MEEKHPGRFDMTTTFTFNQNQGLSVELVNKQHLEVCQEGRKLQACACFDGKLGETYYQPNFNGATEKFVAGTTTSEPLTVDDYRLLAFKIAICARKHRLQAIKLELAPDNLCLGLTAQAVFEGFWRAEHQFDDYLTNKEEQLPLQVDLSVPAEKVPKLQSLLQEMRDIMSGIEMTQYLANQPANVMYPEKVCEFAREKLEKVGVKVEVLSQAECAALGMQAFLAVAQGSDREAKFLLMTYEGNPASEERLGLVGKGICYDAGGYSIKSTEGMSTMFTDMTGGATVIGAMYAIAEQKLPVNVVGATALCENMLSGSSYKPGDIIGSLAGKTIEVANTDAEGRVTLADSVNYVTSRCHVTKVIDIATLTGACLVALGEEYTGVVSDSDDFYAELVKAAQRADEKIWRLPVSQRFKDMNKSKRADIKNVGGRLGGTITAGLFVREFVAGNIPWLHLDIAGTAYLSQAAGYLPLFATGTMVKTFYFLAKQEAGSNSVCRH